MSTHSKAGCFHLHMLMSVILILFLLSKAIEVSQPGKNGGRLGILEMVFLPEVIHWTPEASCKLNT